VTSELLIGREEPLRVLDGALADAAAGGPRLAVVEGEAGVGKSRVLQALEQRARERGFIVLHGESIEFGGEEFAYAPIVAALRDLPGEWTLAAVSDFAPDAREAVAALLPRLDHDGHAPEAAASARYGQGRLYELVLGLLGRLAEEDAPVLVALEDVHWADRSTHDFLAFYARNVRAERIALAVTCRSEEISTPLRRLLSELSRRPTVARVGLEVLDRDGVARQLEAIAGAPVPASVVEQVHARGGGNPFFGEELFAAMAAGERLPATVAEAVRLRTGRLERQDLLRVVAAAGGRIEYGLLDRLAPDASPALRPALDAGILVRDRDDAGVAFRHGLMGEVVYSELLPPERTALHLRIARALADAPAAPVATLAYQWYRAGDREEALRASAAAGVEAARVYAFAEASGHFERALELWDDAVPLPIDKVELLSAAAQAARFTGDHERAVRLGFAALELEDDPVRRALIHERLGEYHYFDDEAALEHYRQALELLPDSAGAERARVLAAEGDALLGLRRWHESVERCEAALAVAGDGLEASVRITLGLTLTFLGRGAEGETELRRGLERAESLRLAEDTVRGYIYLGEVLRVRGDRAAALEAMVAGERIAAELGMRASFGSFMFVNAVEDLLALGRWDEAERRVEAADRMELSVTGAIMHRVNAGLLSALRGDLEAAGERLEQAVEAARDPLPSEIVTPLQSAQAALALIRGLPDEARRHVEEGLARIGDSKDLLYTPVLFGLGVRAEAELAERARSRRHEDDVAAGRSRAEALLADLDRTLAAADHAPPEALAQRALALAEWGRVAGASRPEPWRKAAAAWDELAQPHAAAYARLRAAEAMLTAGGDRSNAADLLADAHRTASTLGAAPLRTEIELLARRARLTLEAPPTPAEPPPQDTGGLTARELEVLRLLADGLTNREIGVRLFISQKTVGAHVAHVFEKLGVHSRLEAAVRAQQLGVVERAPSP
jgi:DNA-binding CsgD family transcriptional regulator/tetratricopeptide (TPR) repeat protein